jgi:hypothetical protein
MVVIDLLTSMVHLTPSRTDYKARQVAELMFEAMYKLHGLPKSIISDHDVLFTSEFWQHLHKLMGTKLKLSSVYHPQTDGSTEGQLNCDPNVAAVYWSGPKRLGFKIAHSGVCHQFSKV